MRTFIVIPEGLATDSGGRFFVSDYYAAALDKVVLASNTNDQIFLAPANTFGAMYEEEYFGRDYLLEKQSKAEIELIDRDFQRGSYLDTLDNALYLRTHLIRKSKWPLEPVIIVCNKPHKLRVWIIFRLCGYKINKMIVSRPVSRSGRKMVKRLWFYDFIFVQYIYEVAAIFHNIFKFFLTV